MGFPTQFFNLREVMVWLSRLEYQGFNVGFIEKFICTRGFESRYEI